MSYTALKSKVKDRKPVPDSFLDELVAWGRTAPDEIFAPNSEPHDVMPLLKPILGPWDSLLRRKCAMLELLRCLGGFESSWNWNEGVDKTNQHSQTHIEGEETGIFQVSYDSLWLEKNGTTLSDCLRRHGVNPITVREFIDTMKSDHTLALEYAARLLRISYLWDGPIKRGEINSSLSPDAVAELQTLMQ